MNRTLTERARCMLSHMQVEEKWWAEAMNTVLYVTNTVSCAAYKFRTPFEVCFGRKPSVAHFKVFGAQVYALIDNPRDPNSTEKLTNVCLWTISKISKGIGYGIWKPFVWKRRVQLNFKDFNTKYVEVVCCDKTMDLMYSMKNQHYEHEDMPLERQHNSDDAMEIDEEFDDQDAHAGEDEVNMDINTEMEIVPRGRLDGFTGSLTFAPSGPNHLLESETSHSIAPYEISDDIVPVDIEETRPQKRFRIEQEQANAALDLPSTYKAAMRSSDSDEWRKAIQQELQALKEKETWILTSKTAGTKVIGTKWVFALKRNEFGEVEKYKARLVALGYRQKYGVDYMDTYAPVANMNSIRQYGVDTASLNGHLEEEVYIYPPRGVQAQANEVCLLKRSLYGSKQAAATWFMTIAQVILEMGFRHCRTDSCIFVRQRGNSVVYIALYVNDMFIGAMTLEEIKAISDKLSRKFKLKDLGKAKFMLGIQVDYDREQRLMKICQTSSMNKMVEKFNQVETKLVFGTQLFTANFYRQSKKKIKE
uniref:Putative polyprotein n=1 Tax=Albugo laibachii Nc14 TaxID=890382 RepID=F0WYD2_9STRA|nr:putative polyprotein [Albugo laibachii Nc14]|eukprot:CCA26485.1 putative polyprotein [Albugo laibachii Nc14]